MHEIPEFPGSLLLHADVMFQPGRQRPRIVLHEAEHPLVKAQQGGVDVSQVERWAAPMHKP